MTRKTTTRGRKAGTARAAKPAPRSATRTGKKTSSARATKAARATAERKRPATRPAAAARKAARDVATEELKREPVPVAHAEDDEEIDWLAEDEDPRSQIVEGDDDDWSSNHEDEW